ncbi:gluconokinase [Paenibacillus thermoaerophilus]|uniref:Gluconokinase n=1 Tax=Paenibacillus thermoaerophilus TaxID=1215385 RepID=A0ABW2V7Y0_9BACL|nr:gluconokinase [Paenibacillus thermoaerophilus]TMV18753.1 gluconate kinase [Paenibacillus thermoaerophilus]
MTQIQPQSVVVTVDLGTTSTKTMAVTREGRILASHSIEYPLHTPMPDRAEQDPDEIFRAVVAGVRAVTDKAGLRPEDVLCMSFSSAMHSLIAVSADGLRPLTPCITWADNRSAPYLPVLREKADALALYRRTGTPIHPMSPLLKLMWLTDREPELYRNTYKFLGIKEYVLAHLYGRFVIDHSLASATGMFNLEKLDWDEEALAVSGVGREKLPEPVPTTYVLEGLNPRYAAEMGLSPSTPTVVGASDGVLANLGAGAMEPGVVAVTIGTSGAVRGVVNKPLTDPEGRLFCYALAPGYWVVGGPINNGGVMFRWVRDQLATLESAEARRLGVDPYDHLTEIARSVAPGSDGLLFLPFLMGERAPYWNANARGTFFGLTLAHEKKHMIRAVLEGVMYRIQSIVAPLEQLSGPTREVRASGGFARSTFWRQMLSDVLGTSVTVPDAIESSGLGAAQLALLAMGQTKNFDGVHEWVKAGSRHEPDSAAHARYKQLTAIYMNVYHQLKDSFDAIAAYQNNTQFGNVTKG